MQVIPEPVRGSRKIFYYRRPSSALALSGFGRHSGIRFRAFVPTPPLLPEPAKPLTGKWLRRKIGIHSKLTQTGGYAGQVLGSARVDADSSSRELALWREHLVRRGALRR